MESNSDIFKKLHENHRKNNREFHMLNYALSKRELYQIEWKTFTLEEKNQLNEEMQAMTTKIKCTTFENIQKSFNIEFDTLVLDCEGAFYYIIQDDESILKNINKIIIENDYSNYEHKKYVENILIKNNFELVENIDLDKEYHKFHPEKKCIKIFYQVFVKNKVDKVNKQIRVLDLYNHIFDTHSHSISKMSNELIKKLIQIIFKYL